MNRTVGLLLAGALACSAHAHDGDAEDRAMRLHRSLLALDRDWSALQHEQDPARRGDLLAAHAREMQVVQQWLRDAAGHSPCVLLEARDSARQLACLTDTEARLRATERLLGHLVNRLTLEQAHAR